MNAQEAIELSIAESRTVTLTNPTADDLFALMVESSDESDNVYEYWGTDDAGNTWRVAIKG